MTDYVISDHARVEMESDDITEEEVKSCLEHGNLVIKQFVKSELRFGIKYKFKNKSIIVIYTKRKEIIRVITVYPIRRKIWQNK